MHQFAVFFRENDRKGEGNGDSEILFHYSLRQELIFQEEDFPFQLILKSRSLLTSKLSAQRQSCAFFLYLISGQTGLLQQTEIGKI